MKDTLTLSIRVAGLVLVIYTLSQTPVHSMAYTIRPEYGLASYLIPSIIPILAGIIMILFPSTIGNTLSKASPELISIENPKRVVQTGCVILGIIFLFFSISDIVYHASTAIALWASDKYDLSFQNFDYPGAIATIIEFIFALFLINKSKLLVSKINV